MAFFLFLSSFLCSVTATVRFGTSASSQDRVLHSLTHDILRTRLITLPDLRPNFNVGETIEFELFGGEVYLGDVTSYVMRGHDSATWLGDLRLASGSSDVTEGTFELSCHQKACAGNLKTFSSGDEYVIAPADGHTLTEDGEGVYQISQYSATKKRSGIATSAEGFLIQNIHQHAVEFKKLSSKIETEGVDTDLILDCFVMYTPEALAKIGGSVAAMTSKIYSATDSANSILARSAVSLRLRVVGIQSADANFVEPNTGNGPDDFGTLLSMLQNPYDGSLDSAITYRNSLGADLVLLVNKANAYAGLGYVNLDYNPNYAMANYNVDYVYGRVWMHEIGHILGCFHDRYSAALYSDASYIGYGNCWEDTSKTATCTCYSSVMVYDCNTNPHGCTGCSGRDFLANQNVYDAGSPTGEPLASCGLHIHNRRMSAIAYRDTTQPGGILSSVSPSQVVGLSCFNVTITGWQLGTGADINSVMLDGHSARIVSQTIDTVTVISPITSYVSSSPGSVVVSTSAGRVTTLTGSFSFLGTNSADIATFSQADLSATSWISTGTLPWSFYGDQIGTVLYKDGSSYPDTSYAELTSSYLSSTDPKDAGCTSYPTALSFEYWANSPYSFCYGDSNSAGAFSVFTRTTTTGTWVRLALIAGGSDTSSTTYTTLSYTLPANTIQVKFLATTCSGGCSGCSSWAPVRFKSITTQQTISCNPPGYCSIGATPSPTKQPSVTSYPTTVPSFSPSVLPTIPPSTSPTKPPTLVPSSLPTTPTSAPTLSPSRLPTFSPSASPSRTPTSPTFSPSSSPSLSPTRVPSVEPTNGPTFSPSSEPTLIPSTLPSSPPTFNPSTAPSYFPTVLPTTATPTSPPTFVPSPLPSTIPTTPTVPPTFVPTLAPSVTYSPTTPTVEPTVNPTIDPSPNPTQSPTTPTYSPTSSPTTDFPTLSPTNTPSSSPSAFPTFAPTSGPTYYPSSSPSLVPTFPPSSTPTTPTYSPSEVPTLDPTFPPSSVPTSPSNFPTSSPTFDPTSKPSKTPTTVVCVPNERDFCNQRGYCSSSGSSCVCDDPLHYWPSEGCALYHPGSELLPGQYCAPNSVDYYCSWLGTCDSAGATCSCFDSEHRTSDDRCASWSPTPPPANGDGTCVPGDRSQCSNRGYCNSVGIGCICDDPMHFWASEKCSLEHAGPQLASGQCCSPGATDYYCSWMGACNTAGTACVCYDSMHRLPAERCQFWHQNISDPSLPSFPPGTCPPEIWSVSPTVNPSSDPTQSPTISLSPTFAPTYFPSLLPTVSLSPTLLPSFTPTSPLPTPVPTLLPTTSLPTVEPTTASPSVEPTTFPPTLAPSTLPPTDIPSEFPTSNPTTFPPSQFPTVSPTAATNAPTVPPTPSPTQNICVPGDRNFCNNNGVCTVNGGGCICDDSDHYWKSEKCSTWHIGGELNPGQYCIPNVMDFYCSWLGTCNSDGTACNCLDPDHRSSVDRCASWSPSVSVPGPGDGTCTAGDRGYCFNRGSCNVGGDGCVCDDPLHYWSSDRCESSHLGGELSAGDCCIPGLSDYYCGWLGTCDADGRACLCDDTAHRLPEERCSIYHDILPVLDPDLTTCPDLIDLSANQNTKSSGSSSDSSKYPYGWPYWTGAIAFVIVGAVIVGVIYKVRSPSSGTSTRRTLEMAKFAAQDDYQSIIVQMPPDPENSTFLMPNPLQETEL